MNIIQRIFSKISTAISDFKFIFSRDLLVYYWTYENIPNFGDQLNIDLFKHFGYKPILSNPGHAEVFAIGSILQNYLDRYDGIIIGSGYIKPPISSSKKLGVILALRGPKTNSYEGYREIPLCDPGILAKKIFGTPKKCHEVGVVPHFRDQDDSNMKLLLENHKDIKIINVLQKPETVVKEIAQCNIILSSSLHGLVVADAYNIPAVWINFSDRQIGGEFKFTDYHESLGIERKRIKIDENSNLQSLCKFAVKAQLSTIESKIDELEGAFNKLRYHLILLRINRIIKAAAKSLSSS